MMAFRGPLALAVATLLVLCNADPRQEQDVRVGEQSGDRYGLNGHKIRNLDPLGGGHLVRELRESHRFPYYLARKYEYGRSIGGKRDPWLFTSPMEYGYYGDVPKRNFDEIDRSNLDSFVKKRNFDEIDQTSMPFPFKRFYHVYGSNYLDTALSNFDKKRYRPDYPMDEIDLSQFPIGSKRSEISAIHPMR
ncbi:orcokinin peptides-like isoform X2 [Danaus plexippus]|uniref:orcokinin peptides-like isoform X2 n=1 Tax=Danaus plexippus TaxID=13037 RepID=UPI002AB12302|nr:orcokinin peptides-like isoform X2 [Danaus plexippus]